jgi:hypothetical protein
VADKRKAKKSAKSRKSLDGEVSFWWMPRKQAIHLRIADVGMTTVSRKPGTARYHKHLFNKLARCLREAGRPAPKPL